MRGILVIVALAATLAGCTADQFARSGKSWCNNSPAMCSDRDDPQRWPSQPRN